MTPEFDLALRGSQARIRSRAPFFATLALFAQFTTGSHHATDGYVIQLEPQSFTRLPRESRDATLLHLLLHAALQHSARRGVRDKKLWAIAADLIVNGIIAKHGGFILPADWPRDERLENLNVEEVYAVLAQQSDQQQRRDPQQPQPALENDLLEPPRPQPGNTEPGEGDSSEPTKSPSKSGDAGQPEKASDSPGKSGGSQSTQSAPEQGDAQQGDAKNEQTGDPSQGQDQPGSSDQPGDSEANQQGNTSSGNHSSNPNSGQDGNDQGNGGEANQGNQPATRPQNLETYWRNALGNAVAVEKQSKNQGQHALGVSRELASLLEPQISWRDALARLVCRRPVDFEGFDRRFFSRGLYIESLEGISVYVDICIDTSGSISDTVMNLMLGEVTGILVSYPGVKATISYADARLYGPYEFESWEELEKPRGGGGTSFKPFFGHLETLDDIGSGERVAIYLTDGYGDFPDVAPDFEVVWVVIPGGASDESFPFGEVIRMVD